MSNSPQTRAFLISRLRWGFWSAFLLVAVTAGFFWLLSRGTQFTRVSPQAKSKDAIKPVPAVKPKS